MTVRDAIFVLESSRRPEVDTNWLSVLESAATEALSSLTPKLQIVSAAIDGTGSFVGVQVEIEFFPSDEPGKITAQIKDLDRTEEIIIDEIVDGAGSAALTLAIASVLGVSATLSLPYLAVVGASSYVYSKFVGPITDEIILRLSGEDEVRIEEPDGTRLATYIFTEGGAEDYVAITREIIADQDVASVNLSGKKIIFNTDLLASLEVDVQSVDLFGEVAQKLGIDLEQFLALSATASNGNTYQNSDYYAVSPSGEGLIFSAEALSVLDQQIVVPIAGEDLQLVSFVGNVHGSSHWGDDLNGGPGYRLYLSDTGGVYGGGLTGKTIIVIDGDAGNRITLTGNAVAFGNHIVAGMGGADTIIGSYGSDTILGGDGADIIYAQNLEDDGLPNTVAQEDGSATNALYGDAGNDTLIGGARDDLLVGGTDDDRIESGFGNDTVNGGEGYDELYVIGETSFQISTEIDQVTGIEALFIDDVRVEENFTLLNLLGIDGQFGYEEMTSGGLRITYERGTLSSDGIVELLDWTPENNYGIFYSQSLDYLASYASTTLGLSAFTGVTGFLTAFFDRDFGGYLGAAYGDAEDPIALIDNIVGSQVDGREDVLTPLLQDIDAKISLLGGVTYDIAESVNYRVTTNPAYINDIYAQASSSELVQKAVSEIAVEYALRALEDGSRTYQDVFTVQQEVVRGTPYLQALEVDLAEIRATGADAVNVGGALYGFNAIVHDIIKDIYPASTGSVELTREISDRLPELDNLIIDAAPRGYGFQGSVNSVTGTAENDLLFAAASARSLTGGDGDDIIVGNNLVPSTDPRVMVGLSGGDGEDIFIPLAGRDSVNGDFMLDTAVFAGNRSDYQIDNRYENTGTVTITGDDGSVARLNHVERALFADGYYWFEGENGADPNIDYSVQTIIGPFDQESGSSVVSANERDGFFRFVVERTGDVSFNVPLKVVISGDDGATLSVEELDFISTSRVDTLQRQESFFVQWQNDQEEDGNETYTISLEAYTLDEYVSRFGFGNDAQTRAQYERYLDALNLENATATLTVVDDDRDDPDGPDGPLTGERDGVEFGGGDGTEEPPAPPWRGWGDPHLVTLDGLQYSFQAVGEFVLTRATSGDDFEVHIRTAPVGNAVSIISAVATQIDGTAVMIDYADPVSPLFTVGGISTALPADGESITVGAGSVARDGDTLTFNLGNGERVLVQLGQTALAVALDQDSGRTAGSFEGLLGDGDGNVGDDLKLADGTTLSLPIDFDVLYGAYADAWRVSDVNSLFTYQNGQTTEDFTDRSFPLVDISIDELPANLLAEATAVVDAAGITDSLLREAAILDYALTQDESFVNTASGATDPVVQLEPEDAPATELVVAARLSSLTIAEGTGSANRLELIVERAGDASDAISLTYQIVGATGAPISADDIAGGLASGIISFAAGETEARLQIDTAPDSTAESDEGFAVNLALADGTTGYVLITDQVNGTITNDDDPAANIAPVASDDARSTDFETALLIDVLSNDSDSDGTLDAASLVIANGASNGTAVIENGQIRYTPNDGFSGEDSFTYSVQDDDGATSNVATVTVTVGTNPNVAPTNITLSENDVDENATNNTLIGALFAVDANAGDTHSYQLIENAGGRFALDGTNLVVADGALLDYEANTQHTVIVRATDAGGLSVDKTLTITVNDLIETITGTTGSDNLTTGAGGDQIVLGGGSDTLRGPLENFFGDSVDDFGSDDEIIFEGSQVERGNITVTQGSAILAIDSDGDGSANGQFTLTGDFTGGDFMALSEGADTHITFETFLPLLREGQAVDPASVNGIINQEFLKGDGSTDFQVTLRDMGFAGYNNVVGVYEIDASGNIVDTRILFENANANKSAVTGITDVEAGHKLGFFIVQNAASWAGTLAQSDVLSFINGSGAAGNVSDGSALSLAVNGVTVDEMVFHSFAADMNSDGVQHALSGVDVGGEAITIGFEDLTGGGDRDYEDVVFRVETVDDFIFV